MADEREVKVRLIADVAEYKRAMKQAEKRTRKLGKALRALDAIKIRVTVERVTSATPER